MNSGRGSRSPWLGAALLCLAAGPVWAQVQGSATAEQAKSVEAALNQVVAAFNAHDAEKLAALWTADAVHQARDSGAKLEGRVAIAGAYEKLFKADPQVQLQLQLVSLRKVSPEVASLEVLATVRHTDHSTTHSELNVLLARVNDAWQVDEVRETEFSAPAGNPIESLAWLIGQWSDESQKGQQITSSAEWTPGRQFLARSYRQQREGDVLAQGLEIIGWDSSAGQLRCWLFASDGSFAHGYWLPDGPNRWLIKLAGQRPDGLRGSLTQVLERTGDDQYTLQTIDRDWDGAPLPNGQVNTLTRRSEAAPSTDAQSKTRPAPEAKQ